MESPIHQCSPLDPQTDDDDDDDDDDDVDDDDDIGNDDQRHSVTTGTFDCYHTYQCNWKQHAILT